MYFDAPRSLALYLVVEDISQMETPGKKSSEYALTTNVGKAGAVGLLLALITALVQDGGLKDLELTWPTAAVLIVVILSLTAVVVSYNISRGMAKVEHRAPESDPE